jgi:hypothetical protein
MAAVLHAFRARRGTAHARLAATVAGLLAATLLVLWPAEAAPSHSIDSVKISMRGGFVYGSAWFKDTGPGGSRVQVWIETYSGGSLTGSLAHRSGMGSCNSGHTCYTLLSTSLQASAGECYVLRALSARGSDLVQARAPSSGTLCR